jgi:uncharacterized protein (DUF3820 family)
MPMTYRVICRDCRREGEAARPEYKAGKAKCRWCGAWVDRLRGCTGTRTPGKEIEGKVDHDQRMPFGRFQGRPISGIPKPYLRWFLLNVENADADLKQNIAIALARKNKPASAK